MRRCTIVTANDDMDDYTAEDWTQASGFLVLQAKDILGDDVDFDFEWRQSSQISQWFAENGARRQVRDRDELDALAAHDEFIAGIVL